MHHRIMSQPDMCLTWQDPLVSSLLEGLGSASPSHVTSSCMVLMSACTRHGWLGHQELLAGLVAQAVTAPVYPLLVDAVSRLLLQEMDAIVESCSVYISPYSLRYGGIGCGDIGGMGYWVWVVWYFLV